jgi:hypothetical protein
LALGSIHALAAALRAIGETSPAPAVYSSAAGWERLRRPPKSPSATRVTPAPPFRWARRQSA